MIELSLYTKARSAFHNLYYREIPENHLPKQLRLPALQDFLAISNVQRSNYFYYLLRFFFLSKKLFFLYILALVTSICGGLSPYTGTLLVLGYELVAPLPFVLIAILNCRGLGFSFFLITPT